MPPQSDNPSAPASPEADRATQDRRDGRSVPHIVDLRTEDSSSATTELSFRREILQGLARDTVLVPGNTPSDRPFAYSKVIPTVVLYDNYGLELYDKITAVEDYYPFATELGILRDKSHEIACRLGGISTATPTKRDDSFFMNGNERPETEKALPEAPFMIQSAVALSQCSSSSSVEATGFPLTIIELGAGSLKKTSHLLRNVARLLPAHTGVQTGEHLSEARYYALDLELGQLRSTLLSIQTQEESGVGPEVGGQVQGYGICGTYNQGLDWISQSLTTSTPGEPAQFEKAGPRKAILWLGSSIGNFSPAEAVKFLRDDLGRTLDDNTRVLIGIDNCQIPEKVRLAYDDRQGVTKEFILNAITVVARHLGLPDGVLSPGDFAYVSRYNAGMSRNEAYLRAKREVRFEVSEVEGDDAEVQNTWIHIKAGELIMIERSYKFSDEDAHQLFDQAGLRVIQKWSDSSHPASPAHTLYLVERAAFHFVRTTAWPSAGDHLLLSAGLPAVQKEDNSGWQLLLQVWDKMSKNSFLMRVSESHQLEYPNQYPDSQEKPSFIALESRKEDVSSPNRGRLPSMADWIVLWKAWDTVTLEMIPRNMLHQKPIDLRHACLFYLGHIPVFADIHLSRYFKVPTTEPEWFAEIFERGIDPNLDDPRKCHDHSPFPEHEKQWPSLEEVLCFRDKLRKRLTEVYRGLGGELGSEVPLTRRLGRVLAMIYEHEAMHLETLLYMLQQATLVRHPPGFTMPDWDSLAREWDTTAESQSQRDELVEYPIPQTITVGRDDCEEEDSSHPFSEDHQYGWDNESPSRRVVVEPFKLEPAPITNQEYLEFVLEGLDNCEAIPDHFVPESWTYVFHSSNESTKHEVKVKTIYGRISLRIARHWPVQASGSQLERFAKWKGGRLPSADELRVYLGDNPISQSSQNPIGFQNWHPLPARRPRKEADGRWRGGWSGGVWEWTSTLFEAHPNFKPSVLYPGYSKDFFDAEHHVLLGGSWATIPRIAHRPSFVNWYQFKYPYVFAGARVAYDY
ncbi:hypothetical protein PCASD_10081 [Puccinia coronata f. sp. avenae]|uniref:Histidine-specific methyltransferase SAM-dependent domain-containing protein n=2 Tax=Puccinia coronata f. sp. avenae TaxID=200324 RepID=A0A2N5UW74_9BASI|nr:hypothetical protein PCASD_10081 [Puccinia coronata f. sp. avenae]